MVDELLRTVSFGDLQFACADFGDSVYARVRVHLIDCESGKTEPFTTNVRFGTYKRAMACLEAMEPLRDFVDAHQLADVTTIGDRILSLSRDDEFLDLDILQRQAIDAALGES